MSPFALLALQMAMSFLAFGGLGRDVIQPALATRPASRALGALLWVHAFRFIPHALYAPGQIGPDVPALAVATVAWGDFVSSILALLAISALRTSARTGLAATWLFSLVSTLDIVVALIVALSHHVHEHALGTSWFVLVLYVPLVCVSQWLILVELVAQGRRQRLAQGAR